VRSLRRYQPDQVQRVAPHCGTLSPWTPPGFFRSKDYLFHTRSSRVKDLHFVNTPCYVLPILPPHYLTSGIASTFFALVPICIIPFSIYLHKEHVSVRAVAGAVVAVGGVYLLSR
ncbi:MAG: hypothetical protein ACD_75C00649G0001, partial [uncultured bacterium]